MQTTIDYFGESHRILRQTVSRFVQKEIKPYVEEWEETGEFPRELFVKAAEVGLMGVCYPEEWSGNRYRSVPRGGCNRGAYTFRIGGHRRRSHVPQHCTAADTGTGKLQTEAAVHTSCSSRGKNSSPGNHRAGWRLRRGQYPYAGSSRWRLLCGQRGQDHDHFRVPGRFCDYGSKNR